MKTNSTGLLSEASTSSASEGKPLRPPVLDAQDQEYGRKLAALSEEDMGRLIDALAALKPAEEESSFDEIRDNLGL